MHFFLFRNYTMYQTPLGKRSGTSFKQTWMMPGLYLKENFVPSLVESCSSVEEDFNIWSMHFCYFVNLPLEKSMTPSFEKTLP